MSAVINDMANDQEKEAAARASLRFVKDGQVVGRLVFERLLSAPDKVYGQGIGSSYQHQRLALSKHFRR